MSRVKYNKNEFINMSEKTLNTWVSIHKKKLVGSAIFTCNNSLTSKIVSWASSLGKKKEEFIPSHVGSIVEYKDNLFLFNMQPPRASMTTLSSFLLYTNCDYQLIMRDFDIDCKMFSANILYHLGEFYPYLSAIRSVLTKRQSKWRRHCSELHARTLQLCGYKFPENFNMECTPLELYEVLCDTKN